MVANKNTVVCPDCGAFNQEGEEECASCLASLTRVDPERLKHTFLLHSKVSALSLATPPTVPRDTPLRHIIETLRGTVDACVMVTEGDCLEGIFTLRDALYKLAFRDVDLDRNTIAEVMTANPDHIYMTDTIGAAFHKMSVRGYRHLPVFDEHDKLVGHITMNILLRYLHGQEPITV